MFKQYPPDIMHSPRSGFSCQCRGVALVIVLCFVVLLAGLVVAYLSRVTTERQVSNVSASDTKVELLGDSALDVVIGDLKNEITTTANSTANGTGSNTIYLPLSGSNAVPWRNPAISGTFANLIRFSSNKDTPTRAAILSSTTASFNGRSVNVARWNSHYLLPLNSADAAGDSTPDPSFVAPDWVIVTRSGPTNQGLTFGSSGNTLNNQNTSNSNYAVGRYAYAIYDEGGLLDVNVAGYPSGTATSQSGPKGGLAFSDLQQLKDSFGNTIFTQPQIDQIVGWRNYATTQPAGSFPNFTFSGTAAATNFTNLATSSSNSFLTVYGTNTFNGDTDHPVMTRQQLIKLLQGIATTSAQQIQFETALQSLGTFSREVNGPTWGAVNYPYPNAPASYNGGQLSGTSYNPFTLYPKVKNAFTRGDGSQAIPGEPLVKNRFPLDKLALLQKPGTPGQSLSAQDTDDVARYFGLDLVTTGTEASNGRYRHWNYPTTNGAYKHGVLSGAAGIMSLNDVAAQNREPDFFEMLQAGILQGSLGVETLPGQTTPGVRGDAPPIAPGNFPSSPAFIDPDSKITYQILRIGANIIDQWGSDNYPTTITFSPPGFTSPDSVYGIKDLPYLNELFLKVINSGTNANNEPLAPLNPFVYFELWNPHQSPTNPGPSGAYPSFFQISPLNKSGAPPFSSNDTTSDYYQTSLVYNSSNRWYWPTGAYQFFGALPSLPSSSSSNGIVQFTLANPVTDFREPKVSGTIALNPIPSFPPDAQIGVNASGAPGTVSWGTVYNTTKPHYAWNVDVNMSVVYRIQFKDSTGVYRTYGTFLGLDNPSGPMPSTGLKTSSWIPANSAPFDTSTNAGPYSYSWPKGDPRTFRFGSGGNPTSSSGAFNSSLTPTAGSAITSPISANAPFYGLAGVSATNPYRLDMWTVNNSAGGTTISPSPYYPDPDGLTRPGDALYSYPSVSPLYTGTTGNSGRPVILNRPFRSVGELGYAFQDDPWRTLDFFSANSADSALLDLFTLNGNQPVLAGRLDPNTRQSSVLQAVISGATQASGSGGPPTISPQKAALLATTIINHSQTQPFTNRADFVNALVSDTNCNFASTLTTVTKVKTEREAVVRALADCSNTRTWNLLIDLVAQVGRYPSSASSLNQFLVEGERHYWLHVAIDRYTGKVIDKQLEVVRE